MGQQRKPRVETFWVPPNPICSPSPPPSSFTLFYATCKFWTRDGVANTPFHVRNTRNPGKYFVALVGLEKKKEITTQKKKTQHNWTKWWGKVEGHSNSWQRRGRESEGTKRKGSGDTRGSRPPLWILQVLYENDYNGACSNKRKKTTYTQTHTQKYKEVLRKKVYFDNY